MALHAARCKEKGPTEAGNSTGTVGGVSGLVGWLVGWLVKHRNTGPHTGWPPRNIFADVVQRQKRCEDILKLRRILNQIAAYTCQR